MDFTLSTHSMFSYNTARHLSPVSAWGEWVFPLHDDPPHLMSQHRLFLPSPGRGIPFHGVSLPTSAPAFGPPVENKSKMLLLAAHRLKKFGESFHF